MRCVSWAVQQVIPVVQQVIPVVQRYVSWAIQQVIPVVQDSNSQSAMNSIVVCSSSITTPSQYESCVKDLFPLFSYPRPAPAEDQCSHSVVLLYTAVQTVGCLPSECIQTTWMSLTAVRHAWEHS